MARLDKITADEYERKQRWQKTQKELSEHNLNSSHTSSNNHFGISSILDANSVLSNLVPSNSVPSGLNIPTAAALTVSSHQGEGGLLSFEEESEDESMTVKSATVSFVTGDLDEDSSARFV